MRRAGITFDVVLGSARSPQPPPTRASRSPPVAPPRSRWSTLYREPKSWGLLVEASVTVVVVGLGPRIAQTLDGLLQAGCDPLTPVAVIEGGTTTLQASKVTTLAKASTLLADKGTGFPVVAVASHTVGLREALSWFETKALFGWDVLLPCTKEATDAAAQRLAAYGARTTVVPTIAVELPRTPQQMERAVKGLVTGHYEWVAFTSANTVRAVRTKVEVALGSMLGRSPGSGSPPSAGSRRRRR